ncbi:MAG: electron transfer flavoprotein subunit alpha/FixB family protein [Planctomycetota bacterium]|nr:electron transfer flavoprotein subunit alpha/FixB family protein [Planctomycetota bacterium]
MGQNILAIAEIRDGEFRSVSYEIIYQARKLAESTGGEAIAVAVGSGITEKAAELGHWGAHRILVLDDPRFEQYAPEGLTETVLAAAKTYDPSTILFPASRRGKDLSPRVAARLQSGLLVDCTDLEISEGHLVATRPAYAGKVLLKIRPKTLPAVVSLRPKAAGKPVRSEESAGSEVVALSDLNLEDAQLKTQITGFEAAAGKKLDLTEADTIVAGGRGLKGPENFNILEDLAEALGGTVGASRAAVDLGWRPHEDQVGQTGKTVNPGLYIACGISGQIQHIAGMRTSRNIVAINKDAEAPIFGLATYGIVGDLFDVVPRLTEELRKIKDAEH